jgi:dTMP kinase
VLISFDGIQRSGKSTIIAALKVTLEREVQRKVIITEWNSYPEIQSIINTKKNDKSYTPYTWFALHFADFALRYEETILPAIKRNEIVICDRYYYTSFVRDSLKGIDLNYLKEVFSYFKEPDLNFFLIQDPDICYQRHLKSSTFSEFHPYNSGQDIFIDSTLSEKEKYFKYQRCSIIKYKEIHLQLNNSYLFDMSYLDFDSVLFEITDSILEKLRL